MTDLSANFRSACKPLLQAENQLSYTLIQAEKATWTFGEQSIKVAQEHPAAAATALCLVGLCLKTPSIREAVKDAAEVMSTRAAVGIDDALMASRKTVRFPLMVVGKDGTLHLDQPAYSDLSQVYLRARQSVARVETRQLIDGESKYGSATAFAVSRNGKFVTNCHVAVDDTLAPVDIQLVDRFGKWHGAKVVNVDKYNDLAVLQLRNPSDDVLFKPLTFGKPLAPGYNLSPKEDIYCFSHPGGTKSLTGAMRSSVNVPWKCTASFEERGAAVLPIHGASGSSGAPVLNARAEVIGIVRAGPTDKSPLSNVLSVACPSDKAELLLAKEAKGFEHYP